METHFSWLQPRSAARSPCPVSRKHHKKELSWGRGRQGTGLHGAGGRISPPQLSFLPGTRRVNPPFIPKLCPLDV